MGRVEQTVTADELTDISYQCAVLHEDWQRFYKIAATPPAEGASQDHLAFIQVRSRLSCDYPILSHWQKGDFGLASNISKLVSEAGTLESFSRQARAGDGPLVKAWREVNDSIVHVRKALGVAQEQAKKGKPVKLPKEIAAAVIREPIELGPIMRNLRRLAILLVVCFVIFLIVRPFFVNTSFLAWLDEAYTAWQMRNGLPTTVTTP